MSEAAWNKAFTQGSRALQDRLKKVHASNPKFQAWIQKSGHATDTSVKQASKEVKPSARVKSLQTKSLQAYGATKGTKVGGEHGSGEMRDTIAPLTRDQHSKVQAAERAAKAAAKKAAPAKPKKPLSQAERMAAIAKAVKKAKSKDRFDVPTVNPDDMDHDDLRDLHQSLHVRRGYNEEVELDEVTKQEAEKMLGGPVKTRTGSEPKGKLPLGFRRARNLARKAMKTVKESTTEVSEVNEMNHGKKLAKMIMAKQSQHPIAQNMGEENIVEQDDSMEKKEMAQTQLHFIKYAAEEILAFIDMGGEVEEWYQNKLSKVQSEVESLHSYIEGEKRRTGMVEEVEQVDEKAPPGAKYERMVKHIKKGYAKGGLTPQEKSIAYATAWKAYGKKNEEVEQIDESDKVAKSIARSIIVGKGGLKVSTMNADESGAEGHQGKVHFVHHKDDEGEGDHIAVSHHKGKYVVSHTLSGSAGEEKPTKHFDNPDHAIAYGRKILGEEVDQVEEKYMGFKAVMAAAKKGGARDPAAVAAAIGRKKYGKEKFQAAAAAGKKLGEEVEQVDEQSPAEIKAKYYHDQSDKVKPVKAYDKEGKLVGRYRSMDHAKQMKPGHTYKVEEGVVTEAEGKVAVTPKEKDLAAHHGDPTRITYGDVIKARLKSAAAKKMGNK